VHNNSPSERPIVSLVFLRKKAKRLDLNSLKEAADRAFAERFVVRAGADSLNAGEFAVMPTEKPEAFVVYIPPMILGVLDVHGTYVSDPGTAADNARLFVVKRAIQQHRAWLSVDWIGGAGGNPETIYRTIGKLLAELGDGDCLALYSPEHGVCNGYCDDILSVLRGEDPLKALELPAPSTKVLVEGDNPQLRAAIEEARSRWSEFVAAFKVHRPKQGFAVKIAFKEGGVNEYLWVEVERMDESICHGKLVNEPESVQFVKLNDPVTFKFGDVVDWIYSDGMQMVGGFTAPALGVDD
jgi:uncharacterized protein YegJ (DUF2314 family)